MKQIEILFNGLILQVDITSYTPGRPAPIAATPDCPGYDDEGDAEEVEFEVTEVAIDCQGSAIELLDRCFHGYSTTQVSDDLYSLICEKIREESE